MTKPILRIKMPDDSVAQIPSIKFRLVYNTGTDGQEIEIELTDNQRKILGSMLTLPEQQLALVHGKMKRNLVIALVRSVRVAFRAIPPNNRPARRDTAKRTMEVFAEDTGLTRDDVTGLSRLFRNDHRWPEIYAGIMEAQCG